MKLNIAQFIGSFQDGGAESLVRDYCLLLDKTKFNIVPIVLRLTPDSANYKILMERGIRIIPIFKSNSLPLKIIQRLNYWWYVPYRLKKIMRQEHIEVIHIHMALLKYIYAIRVFIKRKGVRILYTCHSLPQQFLCGKLIREGQAVEYLIKHNNLQLIALHSDMGKELNEMFGINNTVVIRNGIDSNKFKYVQESKTEIRKTIGIPENAFVLGHIGRFSEEKNHHFLVDVFAEVYRKRPESFLLMIGDGKLVDRIKAQLKKLGLEKHAIILFHRSDIPRLLKAMDVFVFPSTFEGLGIALIEAQVAGLRCIVSDAVPKEAFQTDLAIPINLNESPQKWSEIILDETIKGKSNGNIAYYDMNKEIKRLENLYCRSWSSPSSPTLQS